MQHGAIATIADTQTTITTLITMNIRTPTTIIEIRIAAMHHNTTRAIFAKYTPIVHNMSPTTIRGNNIMRHSIDGSSAINSCDSENLFGRLINISFQSPCSTVWLASKADLSALIISAAMQLSCGSIVSTVIRVCMQLYFQFFENKKLNLIFYITPPIMNKEELEQTLADIDALAGEIATLRATVQRQLEDCAEWKVYELAEHPEYYVLISTKGPVPCALLIFSSVFAYDKKQRRTSIRYITKYDGKYVYNNAGSKYEMYKWSLASEDQQLLIRSGETIMKDEHIIYTKVEGVKYSVSLIDSGKIKNIMVKGSEYVEHNGTFELGTPVRKTKEQILELLSVLPDSA